MGWFEEEDELCIDSIASERVQSIRKKVSDELGTNCQVLDEMSTLYLYPQIIGCLEGGVGEREGSRPGKRDIGPATDFILGTFWEGREREADSKGGYRATDKFLSPSLQGSIAKPVTS